MKHLITPNYLDCIRCIKMLSQTGEDWPASELGELLSDYHKITFPEQENKTN